MKRALAVSAALVAVFTPLPVSALPPPPEVAVVLVAPPGGDLEADSRLMLESLDYDASGDGWYRAVPAPIEAAAFAHCLTDESGAEACARAVLDGVAQDRPPIVVVMVAPGPGFTLGWRCVGIGETPASPERQNVSMDTMLWRAASPNAWDRDRPTAVGCVLAAAAESGW